MHALFLKLKMLRMRICLKGLAAHARMKVKVASKLPVTVLSQAALTKNWEVR